MTPAERRLQKNGHTVGAIGACAMTWSGMPLSRGSGHFCTCGERRAASTVMLMMLVGAGLTNNMIMCVLGAYLECNDSYLACRFMWRTGAGICACGVLWAADIGMGMLRNGRYVRPATCGVQQLREPGCALWGSSCKLPKSAFAASSGRLEMPCECASGPLFTRACALGTQSCRWRCAPCCRRPRRLYASRCPE
jgi:hypothetical protein